MNINKEGVILETPLFLLLIWESESWWCSPGVCWSPSWSAPAPSGSPPRPDLHPELRRRCPRYLVEWRESWFLTENASLHHQRAPCAASSPTLPISSAIFCLWVLFFTPLKRILFSSSSSSSLQSCSSRTRRFFGVSVSTRGASPPSSLASCLRFLAAWMNAASGISPTAGQKRDKL